MFFKSGQNVGFLVLLFQAMGLSLVGCSESSSALVDSNIEGKIVVHTRGGKVVHSFERKQREETRKTQYDELLFFSALSPSQEDLLVTVGYDMPKGASAERRPKSFELVRVTLENGDRQVLFKSGTDQPLLSPQWTKDGKRIVLLCGNQVLMLSREGEELWRAPIPEAKVRYSRERADSLGGYIRLSADEKKLYLSVRQEDMKRTNMATMDLETKTVTWSDLGHVYFTYGKAQASKFTTLDEGQRDLVTALFGSPENPVFAPKSSADGRYYFYHRRREGFFARNWVEGYSRETAEVFTVMVYGKQLYAE